MYVYLLIKKEDLKMTNYSNEPVHVKAYIKDDGTRVKEHWRGHGPSGSYTSGVAPGEWEEARKKQDENRNERMRNEGIYKSEQPKNLLQELFKNIPQGTKLNNFGMSAADGGGAVLTGGVSFDDISGGGGFGDAVGAVVAVIAQVAVAAAKIAIEVAKEAAKAQLEAQKSGNFRNIEQYDTHIDNSISKIESSQDLLKDSMKNTVDKLIKTKDQSEYTKLLETHALMEKLYDKNNRAIRNIKISAHNRDYLTVMEELRNYQTNFEEVTAKNRAARPINTVPQPQKPLDLNSINYTSNPVPTPYMPSEPFKNTVLPIAQKQAVDTGMFRVNVKNLGKTYDAKEMWKASSHDFNQSNDYISKNGNVVYSVSQLPSQELQQTVQAKLQEQLGTNDAMGVVFRADSSLSQAIANSREFQEHVRNNLPKLVQGETIKGASKYFESDKNLKLALGHADILYTTLTENGDLYALVLDTYDFNANDPDLKVQQARAAQEARLIRNYYILSIIFIHNYKLEQLLRVRF